MSVELSSGLFPHGREIAAGDARIEVELALRLLRPLLSVDRIRKIEQVARGRTYATVPVLENLYDRGNASAVMRTAEALGFQRVDVIERGDKFKRANRVTQGADKWLDVFRWKSSAQCVSALKTLGYRVLATGFEPSSEPVSTVDFSKPTAIVFGNEKDGVSLEARAAADGSVMIPMHGFVQSFNISVAAAICLHQAYRDRVARLGRQGDVTPEQARALQALFSIRSARNPERLVERLLARASLER